jgi:hypothetical protein
MFLIYRAVNDINGHRYVGVTSRTLPTRRDEHHHDARYHRQSRSSFHRALRKYGESAFTWSVLLCAETRQDAYLAEAAIIARDQPEYNQSPGGRGGTGAYLSRRVQRSDGRTFPSASAAAQESGCSYSLVAMLCKNGRLTKAGFGFRYLDETKCPGSRSGRPGRAVICVNDSKSYSSSAAAAVAYGVSSSSVGDICRRKPKCHSVKGLVFRFVGDEGDLPDLEMIGRRRLMTPIVCCTDGKTYHSIGEAAAAYGVGISAVSAVLCGKTETSAGGRVFRYADDPLAGEIVPIVASRAHDKAVICENDGKRYVSASAAAREYGLNFRHVSKVALGQQKTTGGLVFRYV